MAVKPKISDLQQIGINIRRIRTEKSISRAQLAYEIGSSEKHLSRIELGEVNSGIVTYLKIVRVLNISLADLTYKVKI
ncbi:MAG: helix-turn-helix domain-containing protein [Bacteroidetes bacterium]|nr:helix-turn-helix domain-containing protein [Bacteroidota bacterium]MCA6442520.1 helix-turn-helix domain-containing protein [Bacteroidota bacterium]